MHHSGNFGYGSYNDAAYGYYGGFTGQYAAPVAKRFRHEKWNGMRGSFPAHTSQNTYTKPGPNPYQYQYDAPYVQQSRDNFSQQNMGHSFGFGWQPYPADQSMRSNVSQPYRPGYSRGSTKQSKRGNRGVSQFTNQSTSDLRADIMQRLAANRSGGLQPTELARVLSCEKKAVNQILYSMQREGLVEKISEQPPVWVLKTQVNVPATHSSGFNSQPDRFTSQKNSMLVNHLHDNASSHSVVPLGVQGMNDKPVACSTAESFDMIPAVAIRNTSVSSAVDVHSNARASCGFDPPTTALKVENASLSLSSPQDVGQVYRQDTAHPNVLVRSNTSESFDVIPVVAITDTSASPAVDIHTFACASCGLDPPTAVKVESASSVENVDQVYQQDIAHPNVLLRSNSDGGDAPAVNAVSMSLQAVPELRKPAGRGRGVLLLNTMKNRLANTPGTSSAVLASTQSNCDRTLLEADRFSDDGQYDSGIIPDITKQPPPVSDIQSKLKSERVLRNEAYTASCEVSSGARVDQSSGTFKVPLPPKQLITADPMYKVAMQREVGMHSKDDTNLLLHGTHLGSSFAQNRVTDFTNNAESDSYKSLPESLSALSFHAPSLPSTRSLGDLRNSCAPGRSVDNPFASALGIEDTYGISDVPSGQMPEGASGLSLTGESFAALNKNSVSALMEYSQSRHINVEVKCIGSFGPPHRPVYVSKHIRIYLSVCV